MVGTNLKVDMSSNVRNTGSRLLLGEGDLTGLELLTGVWSRRGGETKLSMDLDRVVLRGIVGLSG